MAEEATLGAWLGCLGSDKSDSRRALVMVLGTVPATNWKVEFAMVVAAAPAKVLAAGQT